MNLDELGITATQPDENSSENFLRNFLEEAGFHVADFPKVRVVLELSRGLLKNSTSFVALRIPSKPGFVFETYARVIRTIELPLATEGHRKFVEVEWFVDENALLEAESHAAFSFVSGEVQCPSCKYLFLPDAQVIDEHSIRMSCPSCLHYWTIRVESPVLSTPMPRLLTDLFYRDPSRFRKVISGSSSQSTDGEYFPTRFKGWESDVSLSWLFEDRAGFLKVGGETLDDFDIIWKSFLNSQFFNYFTTSNAPRISSNLDSTEIFRKSEIAAKVPATPKRPMRQASLSPRTPQNALEAEFPLQIDPIEDSSEKPRRRLEFKPITQVRSATYTPETPHLNRLLWISGGIAASLALVVVAFFYFQSSSAPMLAKQDQIDRPEQSTPISAEEVKAPIETKTLPPTTPVVVEAKPEVKTPAPTDEEIEQKRQAALAQAREKEEQMKRAKQSLVLASFNEGTRLMEIEKFSEASAEFQKVLELDPQHGPSYRNLGIIYVYDKRYNEAIRVFERYLDIAEDSQDRGSIEEMLATLRGQLSLEASQ